MILGSVVAIESQPSLLCVELACFHNSTLEQPQAGCYRVAMYKAVGMKSQLSKLKLILGLLVLFALSARAVTHYVDLNSPNPTPPFTNWLTAASVIQDAINAAEAGDEIVVSNGVYASGGLVIYGTLTNRVAVTKQLVVRSVHGPKVTAIKGYQVPGITNGPDAVRCVYLTNGALLSGFTITNGATDAPAGTLSGAGGAVWCESTNSIVTNCVMIGNSAWDSGGASYSGTLLDCVLSENTCFGVGGGSSASVLIRCRVFRNFAATDGGGAVDSELYDSTIHTNTAGNTGGGARYCVAVNCIFQGNTASTGGGASGKLDFLPAMRNCEFRNNVATQFGGGVSDAKLDGCSLIENVAGMVGGGAHISWLTNCILIGNSAEIAGGAANYELVNCTIVSNRATVQVGGAAAPTIKNCVIYHNTSPDQSNYDDLLRLDNCCTQPMPPTGNNNFTNAPMFINAMVGNFRLQSNSPGINAGENASVTVNSDRDGRPRIAGGNVDVGAYEYHGPGIGEFIDWLDQASLPTDGSADFTDTDGDGANNWQEWRADTIPTNLLSVLRIVTTTNITTGANVTWESVATRNYWLERATNLAIASPFQTIATNIVGAAGTKTYTDTNATSSGPYFYRVGVH